MTEPNAQPNAGRRGEAEIALWDRHPVEVLAARQRAVQQWACEAAFSANPVSAENIVDRIARLRVALPAAHLDDQLIQRLATILADDALEAVVRCLQDCSDPLHPQHVAT